MTTATLTPIREAEVYDDTVETPADRQARQEARKNIANGNFTEIDLKKAQTFEGFMSQLT